MEQAHAEVIIKGVTRAGQAFRPSDWAERLCGVMSSFGNDQQMRYSPYVRPTFLDGVRCVFVRSELKSVESRAWRFLFDFANDNELVILEPAAQPR